MQLSDQLSGAVPLGGGPGFWGGEFAPDHLPFAFELFESCPEPFGGELVAASDLVQRNRARDGEKAFQDCPARPFGVWLFDTESQSVLPLVFGEDPSLSLARCRGHGEAYHDTQPLQFLEPFGSSGWEALRHFFRAEVPQSLEESGQFRGVPWLRGRIQGLQPPVQALQGLRVEGLNELVRREQVLQEIATQGRGTGTAVSFRFVPLVHVNAHEAPHQPARQMGRYARADRNRLDLTATDPLQNLEQMMRVHHLLEAISDGFEGDGEVGLLPYGFEQIFGFQALEPERCAFAPFRARK